MLRPAWARNAALLLGLVLAENSYVLLTRYTRTSKAPSDLYSIQDLVLMTEVGKLGLSLACEYFEKEGHLLESFKNHSIISSDGLKTLVPASLYFLQNSLFYYGLSNLPSPVFQVIYQVKILMTAGLSSCFLAKSYSTFQWVCLVLLMVGMSLSITSTTQEAKANTKDRPRESFMVGIGAVMIATFCSSLAGVAFEKLLKGRRKDISIYMQNVHLAVYSLHFAMIQYMWTLQSREEGTPFLHGFTTGVWILVLLRSWSAILVAFIVKYMNTVTKLIASSAALIIGCYLSAVLLGTELTAQFWCGALLVSCCCYAFMDSGRSLLSLTRSLPCSLKAEESMGKSDPRPMESENMSGAEEQLELNGQATRKHPV